MSIIAEQAILAKHKERTCEVVAKKNTLALIASKKDIDFALRKPREIDRDTFQAFLRTNCWGFNDVESTCSARFLQSARLVSFNAGSIIVFERSKQVYFFRQGWATLIYMHPEGGSSGKRLEAVCDLAEGHVFGDISREHGWKRQWAVLCKSEVEAFEVPSSCLCAGVDCGSLQWNALADGLKFRMEYFVGANRHRL